MLTHFFLLLLIFKASEIMLVIIVTKIKSSSYVTIITHSLLVLFLPRGNYVKNLRRHNTREVTVHRFGVSNYILSHIIPYVNKSPLIFVKGLLFLIKVSKNKKLRRFKHRKSVDRRKRSQEQVSHCEAFADDSCYHGYQTHSSHSNAVQECVLFCLLGASEAAYRKHTES